ncbi:hypothetical protein BL250_02185 [Erwinia sp. OLTSP20]|uniref:3-oxo-tetronate kinase n=1 Tax=unclassified Erwinia TaxID=2622719 RepID=UPI000C1A4AAE|nr:MULTISPECIES: 3-oxo-tetronate kinase [unclassified Erwinia]PIJ52023.1 hypothetical protein BV501_01130 [Erwinia sp. OAMSP11]PIJ75186.1 hypothetical protein BK416_02055 [Erwinia sp. OLSSP12]PIJ84394.1 hypothetical protein BLD47_01950 [Erwinia sp. OLCASP19]PIJ87007.1 hypothetical protein BLD46_01535 [Erwinia sp. OLMTSP26]PIJ88571.1 hypothetical protein BLD49_01115 [Erwinia sp. OLMDSP33]
MCYLGVIADDFTGATDIASFLAQNGMSVMQYNGIPAETLRPSAVDALVISLKSRSCPAKEAVSDSLAALRWLKAQGCQRFYFKYCSTFDSTAQGNIGPVTDALLDALGESQTVISPALPVNGRTVYQGYLFVHQQLLAESGMRHHPVTPMRDSQLIRLMEQQAAGRAALIPLSVVRQGSEAVRQQLTALRQQKARYVVIDAISEDDLLTQAEACGEMPLLTGGSGLGLGVARYFAATHASQPDRQRGLPVAGPAVVISGSCSTMTNAQVARYASQAAHFALDIVRCIEDSAGYAGEICRWVVAQRNATLAPMVYATADAEKLQQIQQQYGAAESSQAIEQLFARLVPLLAEQGIRRFIVAGGETSGVVTQALNITGLHIGPTISPGIPWVRASDKPISLALKSGNFGDENFFARAQLEFMP